MRRRAKVDRKHHAIIKALRSVGCDVADTSVMGQVIPGFPDALVHRAGRLWLMEFKDEIGPEGGASRDGQKLSEAQRLFALRWPVEIARSTVEALRAVGAIK